MAIIIEDGTGVENANSYVTVAEFQSWLVERGYTITGDPEQLLIRAMDYIESLSFIGESVHCGYLQWPRYCVHIDGCYFPSNEIPKGLKLAQMQTALSIDAGVDPLSTLPRTISSVTVGPISVSYESGSNAPTIRSVAAYLSKLTIPRLQSFRVYRGG